MFGARCSFAFLLLWSLIAESAPKRALVVLFSGARIPPVAAEVDSASCFISRTDQKTFEMSLVLAWSNGKIRAIL